MSGDGVQVPLSLEAFHGLAAAYALDALDDADRAAVERALASSPEFRDELDRYAESVAHLAELAEPVEPPPGLKPRLMAEIERTPQLTADAAATTGGGRRRRRRGDHGGRRTDARDVWRPSRLRRPPPWHPITDPALPSARRADAGSSGPPRSSARPQPPWCSSRAPSIGVGWPGPNGWGAQLERAAIAAAPDAQTATAEAAGGGEVTLVWSAEQGRSVLVAEGLPDVGADETYELWYIDDAGASVRRHVRRERARRPGVSSRATSRPGVAVGVTVEPAGGSPQPTTEPLVVIQT